MSYAPDNTVRAVKLSDRIRYFHCENGHGVLFLFQENNKVPIAVEVETQDEFIAAVTRLKLIETSDR